MVAANTLAYYDMTIITAVKRFYVYRLLDIEMENNIKLARKIYQEKKRSSLFYARSVLREKVSNI
jgi:hypothetical protein